MSEVCRKSPRYPSGIFQILSLPDKGEAEAQNYLYLYPHLQLLIPRTANRKFQLFLDVSRLNSFFSYNSLFAITRMALAASFTATAFNLIQFTANLFLSSKSVFSLIFRLCTEILSILHFINIIH